MSTNEIRIALAQINSTVGDLSGNANKIVQFMEEAKSLGADVVAFPELALTGYPPEDLVLKPQFIAESKARMRELAKASEGITAIIGFVDADGDTYNAAAIVSDGALAAVYHKIFLPNYGVFDEKRYFKRGSTCPVFKIREAILGVNICEDIWYDQGPTTVQAEAGAEVIININGSPYDTGKLSYREKFLTARATDNGTYICYVNLVGGQDELVFDGGSMILNPSGHIVARGRQFEEDLVVTDLEIGSLARRRLHGPRHRKKTTSSTTAGDITAINLAISQPGISKKPLLPETNVSILEPTAEVYMALVLGTRDYVRKNGFSRILVGLSGGIDSSLVTAVAADALGRESIIGVAMPSRYNAEESLLDAETLATNFGIEFHTISIEDIFKSSLSTLLGVFQGTEPNVAEENLQARIRGNILMAISNKFGWLVLTTGNKSEMAMGYATLYGDMAGGFAVIKDVPKTLVYKLATHRNKIAGCDVIPSNVLQKAPTAELRPNQLDEDSLPPYSTLDPILKAYVEDDRSFSEMVHMGFDEAMVKNVITGVDRNEYKRRQAPPGVKITPRAFGRDRRLPLVNKFKAF
ncbi:NAD+ synthase [Dehalococcoidia bacterium]|nr:NAD+ synthase [Dehalococcoidia bacterium]